MKNNSQQSISKPSTYTKAAKSNITSQDPKTPKPLDNELQYRNYNIKFIIFLVTDMIFQLDPDDSDV